MKSIFRLTAISAFSLALLLGAPSLEAATKKGSKKTEACCACCKDGKCTDPASKDGKCAKCDAGKKS